MRTQFVLFCLVMKGISPQEVVHPAQTSGRYQFERCDILQWLGAGCATMVDVVDMIGYGWIRLNNNTTVVGGCI